MAAHAKCNAPQGLKLKNMDEKNMHNLFLKNMSGLIIAMFFPFVFFEKKCGTEYDTFFQKFARKFWVWIKFLVV